MGQVPVSCDSAWVGYREDEMKKSLKVVLLALMAAPFAQAQPRTWAFSKDTVYGNQSGVVNVTNTGIVPLRFDSLYLERIKSTFKETGFRFGVSDSVQNPVYFWSPWSCQTIGPCDSGMVLVFDTTKVPQIQRLYDVEVDYQFPPQAETFGTGVGDSVKFRAIFVAKNSRGRDTLIIMGTQRYPIPSGIIPLGVPDGILKNPPKFFDLRGRRMDPPKARVAPTPLVSPQ
jgi:hypothetical protein